jgi:transcription elongation GreA/GreB family factor
VPTVRKPDLKTELLASLTAALAAAESAYATAVEGATHSESKAEGDKDTRATEQSYVARGQAMRVDELRTGIADVEKMPVRAFGEDAKIASGALVTVEDQDGDEHRYFIAPSGGGTALAQGSVQVVTPRSPLGGALCGKTAGDELELTIAGKRRALTITAVE